MVHIRGNRDGKNRRNESYKIGSRLNVPRKKAVQEVKKGIHQDVGIIEVKGREYLRDKPDKSKKDNVNRE